MIVICEDCGKKYRIDPAKIKGNETKVTCKACRHVITIQKPEHRQPEEVPELELEEVPEETAGENFETDKTAMLNSLNTKQKGIGIRTKMAVLFVLIPIVLVVSASLLYLKQINTLSSVLTNESSVLLEKVGKEIIADKARSVAKQCRAYLLRRPGLAREGFNNDSDFNSIAVQKVGLTGYTCLYSKPAGDGFSSLWAHPNPKVIGVDVPKAMRKPLGSRYDDWWAIYKGAYNGKESQGYYPWQDRDGVLREKFMVCTPIEGMPYIIASTTYLDEFTQPVKSLTKRAATITSSTRNAVLGILAGTLLLLGLVVTLFSNALSRRIKSLTDVAERISVGDLGAEVEVNSKDEIGDLAHAISRMQASIRISLKRLRRRR